MLLALVAHARDVPGRERDRFAERLGDLAGRTDAVLVRTCQRVELYLAVPGNTDPAVPGVTDPAVPGNTDPPGVRRLVDADAVEHLIRVACGLDSAVLGEEQVLHQVRAVLAGRAAAAPLDGVLDRLFQIALRAGRRAQAWYPHPRPSLADAALDEIEKRRGPVAGEPVLIVGAGRMGRLAVRAAVLRGAAVMVTNRTPERASALASSAGVRAVPWPGLDVIPEPAGVVVAVAGRWPLQARVRDRLQASGAVVVDLSSPAAVDAAARAALGQRCLSVDELAWRPATGLGAALEQRLDTLVQDSGRDYCRWLRTRQGGPTIHRLTRAAEQRRQAEVAWLRRRLPDLTEREAALVEQMSRRLVAGLLHQPYRALHDDDSGVLLSAARQLFALPTGESSGAGWAQALPGSARVG